MDIRKPDEIPSADGMRSRLEYSQDKINGLITFVCHNRGEGTLHRLVGKIACAQDPRLNDRYLFFGNIKPGRQTTRKMRIPENLDSRGLELKVQFHEANGYAPDPLTFRID